MSKFSVKFEEDKPTKTLLDMPVMQLFVVQHKETGGKSVCFIEPTTCSGQRQKIFYVGDGLEYDDLNTIKDKYKVLDIKADINIKVNHD